MFILKGHKHPVQRVEFSADGTTLLSVDAQRKVRLWDLETRTTRWALEGNFFASVTFTPDCRHVLTCDHRRPTINSQGEQVSEVDRPNHVLLHDVETGTASPASIQYGPSDLCDLTFSPDGTRCVAQGAFTSSELWWWEYPSGRPLRTWDVQFRNEGGFGSMTFSPDGRTLAGMDLRGVPLIAVPSGDLRFLYPFEVKQGDFRLAFHPNGKYLAIGFGPKMVILDLDTRQEISELRLPKKYFLGAAFTRDGRFLATVSNEETVKFWDTSSWRVAQEYAWEVGGLRCIAFDRDGFRAAAAGTGKKIVVWDLDE
jgi:WD40 repeat protein